MRAARPGGHKGRQATQGIPTCKAPLGLALYLHLPYCVIRCPYCDFFTLPADHPARPDRYLAALSREIQNPQWQGWEPRRPVSSVYFGGGTPSVQTPAELSAVLANVREVLRVDPAAEITMEINPETVTREAARAWRSIGFNRVSLGVQSLNDECLRWLGRGHTAKQARTAVEHLREAGFKNISVDFMFGLRNQTPEDWRNELNQVVSWDVDHISAYALTIEQKTRFGSFQKLGRLDRSSEDAQAEMFVLARRLLEDAGLPPYEISNFARPGFESRHNLAYWRGEEYWGVGVSAHSFQKKGGNYRRFWNARSIGKYLEPLEEERTPMAEEETLSPKAHLGERLMTGLRLTEGVSLSDLARELSIELPTKVSERVARFVESGHLQRKESRHLLTERGLLVSNEVFRELL